MNQVHGSQVYVVGPDAESRPVPTADGLVTKRTDVALAARAADCVPILLADSAAGVVGAVHSGRPGLYRGVVPATVAVMRSLGADRLAGGVGGRVCGRCWRAAARPPRGVADS